MRLTSHASPAVWVPVTESFGLKGRRHRKAAIRMLLAQAQQATGIGAIPGGRFGSWLMSQAAPLAMRKADGRVLAWAWKVDPELVVAIATAQLLTPQLRTARAMMPMEYDDTEDFPTPLGVGEKLVMLSPPKPGTPPFATYTWDTGTHLITLNAVSGDREKFGTVIGALDDLARSLRILDDLQGGESPDVLRIGPA